MVSDGIDPTRRYRIAVEVTIAGSEITFDFSGTDDQAPGFTNMPRGVGDRARSGSRS